MDVETETTLTPMTIEAGKSVGNYKVVSAIGAGGMGEVYRAHDSRLDREVAIKLLPADFANDADRLRRFEQEAAFKEVDGVFVLPPSEFDPAPGFPKARAVINAVKTALEATRPRRVVCLSTIGAQATKPNLLTQRTLMEQESPWADDSSDVSTACMVHGKLRLGCSFGARQRRHC